MVRECVTLKSAVLTILVVALIVALLVASVVVVVRRQKAAGAVDHLEGVDTKAGDKARGPPLPVVLVHGLFGFDRIGVPGVRFDYFRGIAKHLETLGCHVHAVKLPPYASVPARAKQLAAAIEALPHERVDVIAHSLGGLDARYALAHLGLANKVRALVTIGTPHRGSPIADLVLRGPIGWGHKLLRTIGMPLEAVEWLSTDALARFNREVPDAPGVRYACVVGGMHRKRPPVPLPLMAAHAYLKRTGGVNDGLVCVSSQYWGEVLAEIEADHFAQVGWKVTVRGTFDALGLYAFIVARLGDDQCATPNEIAKEAG